MARGGQGLVAESIEALRSMGLSGDDGQLLHLLKAADYNLERAVNFYLDGGMAAPPVAPPPSTQAGPSHAKQPSMSRTVSSQPLASNATRKAAPIQVHDDSEDEPEGEEEEEEGGCKAAGVCKHGQGPDCAQCTTTNTLRAPSWPLVMGQRLVEGYSVGKGGALRQAEPLHVTIDSGNSDRLGASSSGAGRGGKRKAATHTKRAAAVRFRSQGGVEGRLPTEVGALLMPLLAWEGGPLITVHAEALYSLTRIEYFTKLPLLLRVCVCESFFKVLRRALQVTDDLAPPTQPGPTTTTLLGNKKAPSALSVLGKGGKAGTQTQTQTQGGSREAQALGAVREAALALVCFLHTAKAEGGAEESGERKRQKMLTMASSASASASSSAQSANGASASGGNGAGPSKAIQGEGEGKEEGEGEARVEEGQLERLYRLNEQYNRQLPRYEGHIHALRGLELRDYQRQALEWMLQREADNTHTPPPQDDAKPAAQPDDGGELVLPLQGLVQAPPSLSHRFPSHHELWDRHFLAALPPSPTHTPTGKGILLSQPLVPYYVNVWSKRCQLTPPPPPKPCRGGILADDMGMGKTIMLLSLLLVTKQRQQQQLQLQQQTQGPTESSGKGRGKTRRGGTLVVLPLSLMSQWRDELLSHTQHGALSVAFYYGPERIPSTDYLRGVDVVLTTYGTLASEWSSYSSNSSRGGGHTHEGLYALHWTRVILDEAHTIKNKSTESSKAACGLSSDCRWCVTGTPIQNDLGDVFSLLRFLRHQPWDDATWWNKVIQEPFVRGDECALDRLRGVLGPMLLRRTKDATDDHGQRIVPLPHRLVQLVEVEFSEAERDFYQALKDRSRVEFEGYVGSGAPMQAYAQILTLLLRLRQACDHPFLVLGRTLEARPPPSPLKPPPLPDQPASSGSGSAVGATSITPAFLHSLFQRFTSGLSVSSQGQPKDKDRDAAEGAGAGGGGKAIEGEGEERGPSPAYLETLAQQLTSGAGLEGEECPLCLCSPMEEPVLTPCCHVMCRLCLRDTLRYRQGEGDRARGGEVTGECPVCRRNISEADLVRITNDSTEKEEEEEEGEGKEEKEGAEGGKGDEGGKGNKASGGAVVLEGSAKMRRLVHELDRLVFNPVAKEGEGEGSKGAPLKAVVFSQWTHMLDLVAKVLTHKKWGHSRLDGSMSQVQRERALGDFNGRAECRVMVISLKAGGVGLNLTAASIVFLLDPWWNPAVEEQAIDRVHRLGQPQPVTHIFRFVVKDSVEQQMLEIQARKAQVAKHALARGVDPTQQDQGRINLEDFKRFFA